MKVVVCDDDFYFRRQIARFTECFERETKIGISLYSFDSAIKLCNYLKNSPDIDIIFLDIIFQKVDGLKAAKWIRKINKKVCIIFVSSVDRYAVQGYEVQAEGYLLKPLDYETFKSKMQTQIQKLEKDRQRFYYDETKEGRLVIPFDEIIYIETSGRNSMIHTLNGNYSSYRKMKDHQALLKEEGFCRCHAAYIVNMQYVKQVDKQEIFLKNHEVIHISKMKKKEFYNMFMDYVREYYSA